MVSSGTSQDPSLTHWLRINDFSNYREAETYDDDDDDDEEDFRTSESAELRAQLESSVVLVVVPSVTPKNCMPY